MVLLAIGFSIWSTILLFATLGNAIRTTKAGAELIEETANVGIKHARKQLGKIK